MRANVLDKPGEKVRLGEISADPPKGMTREMAEKRFVTVLVARVHDLVPRSTWKERYGHIRDFEELLAEHGAVVLKYFLHITKGEQEQRLLDREKSPETAWKLNPNDWKERDHWNEYTEAYEDAISKTAAKHAPWTVVPSNAKWYRNLVVAESIVDALKRRSSHWQRTLADIGRASRAELRAYRAQKAAAKGAKSKLV